MVKTIILYTITILIVITNMLKVGELCEQPFPFVQKADEKSKFMVTIPIYIGLDM